MAFVHLRYFYITLLLVWPLDSVEALLSEEDSQHAYQRCLKACRGVANSSGDVSCVNFGLERVPNVPECRHARVLDLQNNNINELGRGDLAELTELSYLLLSKNKITSIVPGAFQGLRSLQGLQLQGNNLTELNQGVFAGLTGLSKRLVLSENQIHKITTGVFGVLTRVKLLSLDGNRIGSIEPGSFAGMELLTSLLMKGNLIRVIRSGTFDGLGALQILDLSDNFISEIKDDAFQSLTSLEELRLESNRITSVAPIVDLPSLVFLGLAVNSVEIPLNSFLVRKLEEPEFSMTVQGNPLYCGCGNEPLRVWYVDQGQDRPVCETPEEYSNNALADIQKPFECPFTTVIPSTIITSSTDNILKAGYHADTPSQKNPIPLGVIVMIIIVTLFVFFLVVFLVVKRCKRRWIKRETGPTTQKNGQLVNGYSTYLAQQSHDDEITHIKENPMTFPPAPAPPTPPAPNLNGHLWQMEQNEHAPFLPSPTTNYGHVSRQDARLTPSFKQKSRPPDLPLSPDPPVCEINECADGTFVITPGPVFKEDDVFIDVGPPSGVQTAGQTFSDFTQDFGCYVRPDALNNGRVV